MLYIKNASAKIIHIGSLMLKPDEKIPDKVSEAGFNEANVSAENYSDIPSVKALIRMGILELVEVVYRHKETTKKENLTIHKEYVDVEKLPESEGEKETDAPETPTPEIKTEVVEGEEPKTERKPKTSRKSNKNKSEVGELKVDEEEVQE